ncbi:hypothetical protein [Methanosarcina sp.]|uniref:hypothetical protein n=1 Tax=Methanosarcina sp. TaxID=2213 RepID=UPI002ABB6FFB|nr:hypothetical protein [Methanosarcina sp.]MDY9926803.1 hypothetical protein [Methanosarcina sp.]
MMILAITRSVGIEAIEKKNAINIIRIRLIRIILDFCLYREGGYGRFSRCLYRLLKCCIVYRSFHRLLWFSIRYRGCNLITGCICK